MHPVYSKAEIVYKYTIFVMYTTAFATKTITKIIIEFRTLVRSSVLIAD